MVRLLKCMAICALIFVIALSAPIYAFAQPGEDLGSLQNHLSKIQSQIEALQKAKANEHDDPFGQRVRAVGRQRVSAPPTNDGAMVVRFYDLSDVFSVAPQYPAQDTDEFEATQANIFHGSQANHQTGGGGFGGGGGGGVFRVPPTLQQQANTLSLAAARVSVDDLIGGIKSSVAPDEWDDTNGDCTISVLGNTLLITATDGMHEQIANVLDLLREHWGKLKTISVQTYWIRSRPSEIRELLKGKEKNRVVGKVEPQLWEDFFSEAVDSGKVAYSASMTGHNGQTLNTVSGRQTYLVTDADPLYTTTGWNEDEIELDDDEIASSLQKVEHSINGMYPVRQAVQQGAALQVSPLATRGGNFVILDLHTRVIELLKSEENPKSKITAYNRKGELMTVELDHQDYVSFRLSTTLRCPKGAVILAGGMTYDVKAEANDEPNLYVFVKTQIHTIEEDQSDRLMKE